jgi:hypothetical protein
MVFSDCVARVRGTARWLESEPRRRDVVSIDWQPQLTHRTRYNRSLHVQRRLSPARGQRQRRCLQPSKMNTWNRRKNRRHEVSTWPGREFSAERRRKEKSLTRTGRRSHRASLRRAPPPVGDSVPIFGWVFMFGLRKTEMTS